MQITEKSLKLFTELWNDRWNWGGTPCFGPCGNVETSPEARGNLTHLKKLGLLTTYPDRQDVFCTFTMLGEEFAREQGLKVD